MNAEQKTKGVILLALMVLTPCGLLGWGLWFLIKPLSLGAVRMWAISATLALPIVAFVGWIFGRREAAVKMDGLTTGVQEVTKAAREVADIKGELAGKMRQPPVQIAVAPQLPRVMHRELTDGEGEVVDL